MPKLVSLNVNDMSLRPRNMASNFSSVEKLVLRDMSIRNIDDVDAGLGLRLLGRRLRSLTTNVRTDELLASVVLACPLLTDLCVAYTSAGVADQVSDTGMAFTAHARGLRRVTLKCCSRVTSASVVALAMQPRMVSISMEGCRCFQWRDAQRVMKLAGRLGLDIKVS